MADRLTVSTKPVRSSSTVWVNVGTVASAMLAALALGLGDVGLSELAQARVLLAVVVLQSGVNVWLRLRTHEPLAGTAGERKAKAESSDPRAPGT